MHIVSFGCSLIFGTDLSDGPILDGWPSGSNQAWPALIAAKNSMQYVSRAKGGAGNLCILDRVMRYACMRTDAVFIIGWTYIDRFDYSHPGGYHFNNGLDDYLTLRPAQDSDLNRVYYSKLHSEYKDKFTNLLYINAAIDFLRHRNIPFLMTCVDDLLFCDKWHAPPPIIEMQQKARPYVSDFEGRNFVDWSRNRSFKISPSGHPLEEAHAVAAQLMAPKIDAILHRA